MNVFGLEVSNRIFLHRLVCWELVVREGQVNDNIYFSYSCWSCQTVSSWCGSCWTVQQEVQGRRRSECICLVLITIEKVFVIFFFVRKECEVCLCTFPLEMHVETMYWLLQSLLNPWLVQCFPFQAVTGKIYCL